MQKAFKMTIKTVKNNSRRSYCSLSQFVAHNLLRKAHTCALAGGPKKILRQPWWAFSRARETWPALVGLGSGSQWLGRQTGPARRSTASIPAVCTYRATKKPASAGSQTLARFFRLSLSLTRRTVATEPIISRERGPRPAAAVRSGFVNDATVVPLLTFSLPCQPPSLLPFFSTDNQVEHHNGASPIGRTRWSGLVGMKVE